MRESQELKGIMEQFRFRLIITGSEAHTEFNADEVYDRVAKHHISYSKIMCYEYERLIDFLNTDTISDLLKINEGNSVFYIKKLVSDYREYNELMFIHNVGIFLPISALSSILMQAEEYKDKIISSLLYLSTQSKTFYRGYKDEGEEYLDLSWENVYNILHTIRITTKGGYL